MTISVNRKVLVLLWGSIWFSATVVLGLVAMDVWASPVVHAVSRLEMEFAAKLRQSLPQNITGRETVGEPTSLLDLYAMSIKTLDRRAIFKLRFHVQAYKNGHLCIPSIHTLFCTSQLTGHFVDEVYLRLGFWKTRESLADWAGPSPKWHSLTKDHQAASQPTKYCRLYLSLILLCALVNSPVRPIHMQLAHAHIVRDAWTVRHWQPESCWITPALEQLLVEQWQEWKTQERTYKPIQYYPECIENQELCKQFACMRSPKVVISAFLFTLPCPLHGIVLRQPLHLNTYEATQYQASMDSNSTSCQRPMLPDSSAKGKLFWHEMKQIAAKASWLSCRGSRVEKSLFSSRWQVVVKCTRSKACQDCAGVNRQWFAQGFGEQESHFACWPQWYCSVPCLIDHPVPHLQAGFALKHQCYGPSWCLFSQKPFAKQSNMYFHAERSQRIEL